MAEEMWVVLDFESTGLHPIEDRILECGVMVLKPETLEILATESWLVQNQHFPMVDVVREMHTKNGLLAELARGEGVLGTTRHLDEALSGFLTKHGAEPKSVILVGNSIGQFDRAFIQWQLPKTYALLHHRVIDVSTLVTCRSKWAGGQRGEPAHRALEDCSMSLGTLRRSAMENFGLDSPVFHPRVIVPADDPTLRGFPVQASAESGE